MSGLLKTMTQHTVQHTLKGPCIRAAGLSRGQSPAPQRGASPSWRSARGGPGKPAGSHTSYPPAAERAASPGRALRDVQARLNRYVGGGAAGSAGTLAGGLPKSAGSSACVAPPCGACGGATSPTCAAALPNPKGGHRDSGRGSSACGDDAREGCEGFAGGGGGAPRGRAPMQSTDTVPGLASAGGVFGGASAGLSDIDARLHALQDFLRAAKAGAAAPS